MTTAFIATAVATALLLPPVAYAPIQFRQFDMERLLRLGSMAAIAGLALLAVASPRRRTSSRR